jgi:hypothetical protein
MRYPGRLPTRDGIESMHQHLMDRRPDVVEWLVEERGLTRRGLARYRLGWDHGYVVFPVYEPGRAGYWLKKRGWPEKSSRNARGSVATLYPRRLEPFTASLRLLDGFAVLVAGELDALLLRRHRFPAVTSTNGCLGWTRELLSELVNEGLREAAVVFDVGEEEAAAGLVGNLAARGVEAWRVDLWRMPGLQQMAEGEDVTDALLKYRVTPDDLWRYIEHRG